MKCWSCQADTGGATFCPSCGKLSQRAPGATHFDVFGLKRGTRVDVNALEKQFRELSLKLHPDRFAQAEAKERRLSLEHTTALNDAYKTLKDPTKRAFYLLKLHGIDLDREEQGAVGERAKQLSAPSMEFLEEVMELREALHETKVAKDVAAAQKMATAMTARRKAALADAEAALERLEQAPQDEEALKKASQQLGRVRYFTRFLEEVEAIEEEALA